MAEFSKQYIEKQGGNLWDFDILKIAESLPSEHYTSQICEGYGFIAISKDEYGGIHLGYREPETDNVNWIDYNEIVK